jgi:hypothetical protein
LEKQFGRRQTGGRVWACALPLGAGVAPASWRQVGPTPALVSGSEGNSAEMLATSQISELYYFSHLAGFPTLPFVSIF